MVELHELADSPVFPPRDAANSNNDGQPAEVRDKKGERAAAFFDHHQGTFNWYAVGICPLQVVLVRLLMLGQTYLLRQARWPSF